MDYIIVILLLIFGFSLKNLYPQLGGKEHILIDQLFFYHMIMSFIFYLYIIVFGGDAIMYWKSVKEITFPELWQQILLRGGPTNYMALINFIPSNILNLSFFSGCIMYGTFGHWAIVLLIVNIKEEIPLLSHLKNIQILNLSIYPTILFLPNFHFWSAGIGKDTILFFCVSGFIFAIKKLKQRWAWLIPIFFLSYTIRPHILLFLIAGLGASFILKSKMFVFQKVLIIGAGFIAFLPLLNNVLEFAKIDESSIDSFSKFSETKAGHLSNKAGSGIDISNLPYPLQVFTFLYRPLFFDAPNALGLLASIENIVWLVLSINFFRNKPIKVFKESHLIILGSFLFWLIGALAFAPVLGNLGIIIRERNMFLPAFMLFAIIGLAKTNKFRKFEEYYYHQKAIWQKNIKK